MKHKLLFFISAFIIGGALNRSFDCNNGMRYCGPYSSYKTESQKKSVALAKYRNSCEKNEHFFKLDIRKSGHGKYYGDFDMFPNLEDSNSTRTFYYNLDNDTNTVEQVIEFKSDRNGRIWIPIKTLVSKGVLPYNDSYHLVPREMTSQEQKKYNEQFSLEQKLWEKERIMPF
jgi:hypothetical protein